MTLIVQELRDALVSAGAPEDKANAAAKAVIGLENAATKADLAELRFSTKADLAELKAELIKAMWVQAGVIIGALSFIFGAIATLTKVLP